MKSKILVKFMVVLVASAMVLLLGTGQRIGGLGG